MLPGFERSIWRAAAIAACPSASPPSLVGTFACQRQLSPSASSNRTSSSNKILFWKQPPLSATVFSETPAATARPDAATMSRIAWASP